MSSAFLVSNGYCAMMKGGFIVILNEVKNLHQRGNENEILHFVQNDNVLDNDNVLYSVFC